MSAHIGGIGRVALGTGPLLLIPLAAMRFTDDVNWSLFDFALVGALVFATGLAYELAARRARSLAHGAAVAVALGAAFLLDWAKPAVGTIGEPGGPNVMYLGLLAVGLVGAAFVRFRPTGMVLTMLLMALAQMLAPAVDLIVARSEIIAQPPGLLGVFVLNACFDAIFVASTWLFRRSGGSAPAPA